jgi:hypothetical protein
MAPKRGKLQTPWQLYWEFRLQGVTNRLKFQRTLLEERTRWLQDWEDRAASAFQEFEQEAEDQANEREKRRTSRSRSRGDDNPRG